MEHPAPRVWNLLGIRGLAFDEYPRRAYIITADSCKGVREAAPNRSMTLCQKLLIRSKNFFLPALLWALVFFGFLWVLDFPKPMVDDLFYTRAGVNLAGKADPCNPLLARQEFPSHYFFVYPPLHSFVRSPVG